MELGHTVSSTSMFERGMECVTAPRTEAGHLLLTCLSNLSKQKLNKQLDASNSLKLESKILKKLKNI